MMDSIPFRDDQIVVTQFGIYDDQIYEKALEKLYDPQFDTSDVDEQLRVAIGVH